MKISHKVLKKYIQNLRSPEEVAHDLVMHCAEVEGIHYEGKNLEKVFIGEVKKCTKHPDSEKLNCTLVDINGTLFPIVCGAPNVSVGIKVAVAVEGAQLTEDFIIKKTKIRGEISQGMICSEDELGLIEERQEGIMILPTNAPLGMSMRDYLKKNDAILEIDNKAINHRPDLFSHIGVAREIAAIYGETLNYELSKRDFSQLPKLSINNIIPEHVSRYKGLRIENVDNIESPQYIKDVLNSAGVSSKGILIDISNYSLYLYGQPTHCFDADKIVGNITIRFAQKGESFVALNENKYELSQQDIVIADDNGVLALGGIIGSRDSAVSSETKNIIVESAHFDQAIIRKTGKRLGIRTDALNVFEKDLVNEMQHAGMSLIANELEKNLADASITAYEDIYPEKQKNVYIPFDLNYINNLIGNNYNEDQVIQILKNLGIEKNNSHMLCIPFWRKDLNNKSDIAEEISRIVGYDNIQATVPRINLGAVIQNNSYKIKNDARDFFVSRGFFDMYNYSFVNEDLMTRCNGSVEGLVEMKNALTEDMTHLRGSLIPNLLGSLEKNHRDFSTLQLIETEKVFSQKDQDVLEYYSLAGVMVSPKNTVYYDIQNILSDFLETVGILNFSYQLSKNSPTYAHKTRTADIIIRGKIVGVIGEIHPKVANNFEITQRIGFFEINTDMIIDALYGKVKATELSEFQENNFDLNFVIEKDNYTSNIQDAIKKVDPQIIRKVELIDIYEDEKKLPGKRSITFKIFIQSMESTLNDTVKSELIKAIISQVAKVGGELR